MIGKERVLVIAFMYLTHAELNIEKALLISHLVDQKKHQQLTARAGNR